MKKINYKYLCCIFAPFVIFLLVYFVKGIHYSIVDDTLINYITEGVYGYGQNQFIILPYIGALFTYIMYICKNFLNDFNIYFIAIIGCFVFSFVALNHLFYKKYGKWISLIVISCLQFILLNYLTYTVVAYLLCIVGMLYLLESQEVSEKIIGFIFVFLGIALRKDVFISLIVLFVPIVIYYILKKNKKIFFAIIASISIFIFIEISNQLIVMNYPITQNYIKWNELSTKIRDYSPISYDDYKTELNEANISKNDVDCIYSWIFAEQDTLGNEKMEIITNQRRLTDTYNLNPLNILDVFVNNTDYMIYITYAFIFLMFFKWKNYFGVSVILFTLVDLLALIVRQRVVDRVYISLMISSLMILLYYYSEMFDGLKLKTHKHLIVFLIFLFSFASVFGYGFQEKKWYSKIKRYESSEVYQYVHNNPNKLYVFEGFGGLVDAQYKINSISVNIDKLNKNLMTLGNWDTFSERYYTQMSFFGINNADNFLANLDKYDNVYFIFNENSLKENLIIQWYKEHQNIDIVFEKVDEVSKLSVLKVRTIHE